MSLEDMLVIRRFRRRRYYNVTTSGHRVRRSQPADFSPLPPPTGHHRNDAVLMSSGFPGVMPRPHRSSA